MKNTFLFHDMETGGLNGRLANGSLGMDYYPIFELSFIVTDNDLNRVGEPLRIVVHQSEADIAKSCQWAIDTHTESGLLDEVRASTVSLADAEQMIIKHLQSLGIKRYNHVTKHGPILAGSSIMFDRNFILCQLPKLHAYLHYRQLDISAMALAARSWLPELEKAAIKHKNYQHLALQDIEESIEELKVYRDTVFTMPLPGAGSY